MRLDPPDEGSLDEESLEALVDQLAVHTRDGRSTRCIAYYSPLANGADWSPVRCRPKDVGGSNELGFEPVAKISDLT